MFIKLFEFSFTRNTKQAIGFYIAWFVILAVASGLFSAAVIPFLGGTTFREGFSEGVKIGSSFVIIADTFFAFWIVKSKRSFSVTNVALAFLAGALSIFGGAVLGLIPIAYLTTRPDNTELSA
jgi:hypothetical protein